MKIPNVKNIIHHLWHRKFSIMVGANLFVGYYNVSSGMFINYGEAKYLYYGLLFCSCIYFISGVKGDDEAS